MDTNSVDRRLQVLMGHFDCAGSAPAESVEINVVGATSATPISAGDATVKPLTGTAIAVSRSATHTFVKPTCESIRLVEGLGVEGDAHLGKTVKHRSRVAADPTQPNLRQVHLIHSELHAELRPKGYDILPGQMGENITTVGIDLLSLPVGTQLCFPSGAVVEITGLRNPCKQLDAFRSGLMSATLDRTPEGGLVRKAGIMGIVIRGGDVQQGAVFEARLPPLPHRKLEKV